MESNDNLEIPDRRETSDIPGLPSGGRMGWVGGGWVGWGGVVEVDIQRSSMELVLRIPHLSLDHCGGLERNGETVKDGTGASDAFHNQSVYTYKVSELTLTQRNVVQLLADPRQRGRLAFSPEKFRSASSRKSAEFQSYARPK